MIDIVFAISISAGALSIGFAIAWALGARTRESLVEARARLSAVEQQLAESSRELDAAIADVVGATTALRTESALRARAEAISARVTDLEQALEMTGRRDAAIVQAPELIARRIETLGA